jgi:excisionase family DNA binding protein
LTVRPETAARLLDCGLSTVKAWIADGTLESRKIGSMRLIKFASLKRLIDGQ